MLRVTSCILVLFAATAAVFLSGCARQRAASVPISGLEIAPEYGPTVHVDNFNGSVLVVADPRISSPIVTARTYVPGRRQGLRRPDLTGKVDVVADSSFEDGRRVLRVQTIPRVEDEPLAVDLVVRTPRTEGVRVANAGGPVELVRVSGPITVLNGVGGAAGGDVTIRTGAPMTGPVTLATSRGDILYQVGPGSTGAFELVSDSGVAEFYAKIGKVTNVRPEVSRYRSVLNDGTNPVSLRSGQGTVRVVVIENADTYGPDLWDGYPRWPQYPRPIGRLGGYHNEEPLFRKRQPQEQPNP